jgi:RNA polymerase sigma factor (sigma-70 family)
MTAGDLVAAARRGDPEAWAAIVERYRPLVWAICIRGYRLGRADAEDVTQAVWLRLVDRLGSLRDPDALPGWLAAVTARRCLTLLAARRRAVPYPPDLDSIPDGRASVDRDLIEAERRAAAAEAVASLPPEGRRLMGLLAADPPLSYAKIAAELGVPVGSIGPTRRRCLEKLRRHPAVAGLMPA